MDDGSTDCSRSVLEQYRDRCRLIFQEHQGQAATINRGYECSGGEIVLFLDSDDQLLPNAVACLVEAWKPGLSLLCFRLQAVDRAGSPMGFTFAPQTELGLSPKQIFQKHGAFSISPTSSNAYSRTALARFIPMDPIAWRYGAHTYMNMLALIYGEVLVLNAVLGQRRMHGANRSLTSLTNTNNLQARLACQLELPAAIADHAGRNGLSLDLKDIRVRPGHYKWRMASWRLDSPNHPICGDSRSVILRGGIRAIWSFPRYTFTRSVFTTFALLALALIPRSWIQGYFARIATSPRIRSWIHSN